MAPLRSCVEAFVAHFGAHRARVFVATDDANYLRQFVAEMSQKEEVVWHAQSDVQCSETRTPSSSWLIHSASAVAKAVFYNNLALHNRSVHLEYVRDRQVPVWFQKEADHE